MIVEQPLSESSVAPLSDLDQFFARLTDAPRRLLFLDYDGTLAPFHVDPAAAAPYAGVRERLDAIMNDPRSRLVIVSGRPARELGQLLRLKQTPELWGCDGWEHVDASGRCLGGSLDPAALRRLFQGDKWITRIINEGGRCEVKANGVTIHWRGCGANQIADIRAILFEWWQTERLHKQLLWRDFDGGVGLRVPGRDKGQAVACVLDECPDALAAYLGDDAADEEAFAAINRRGLSALVRPQWRRTAAHVWLRPPEDLLLFWMAG